jgi:hypothetical protein
MFLKNFIKPTKGKIAFMVFFGIISIVLSYLLSVTSYATQKEYTTFHNLVIYFFQLPFWIILRIASDIGLGLITGFVALSAFSIVYWYLISCIIVWIYKMLRKIFKKK